jgi:1,4-alpha-glucan branching enzyme
MTTTTKKKTNSNTGRKRITFFCKAETGSQVYLAGSFNGWNPTKRKMADKENNGNFTTTMMLFPGTYEYKFVINGSWSIDPECEKWVPNSMGGLNSVIKV